MNIPLPSPKTVLLAAGLLCAAVSSGESALLWQADFSSYLPNDLIKVGGGHGGANDTFTSKTNTSIYTVRNAPGTPFSGVYAEMSLTSAATSASVRKVDDAFGEGDVRVLSLDLAAGAGDGMAFALYFINSSNASIHSGTWSSIGGTNIPANELIRVTAVYNRSGADILLPTGDTLQSGYGTFYYKKEDGTYHYPAGTPMLTQVGTAAAGFSLNWQAASLGETGLFDNVGYWSSAADMLNGVNVLALDPGAVMIPEPGTAALLLGGAGLAAAWRHRKQRQKACA